MTENTETPSTAAGSDSPLFQIFQERTDRNLVEFEDQYIPHAWPSHWAEKEPITERDILHRLALQLSMSHSTSFTDKFGVTQPVTTSDGMAAICDSHTFPWTSATWSNRDHKARRISQESLLEAWRVLPAANAIITSDFPETMNAAKELLNWLNRKRFEPGGYGCTIDTHLVIPELVLDAMGNPDSSKSRMWFLADLKNSRAHFKRLPDGRVECCVLSPFWIYGSFPN